MVRLRAEQSKFKMRKMKGKWYYMIMDKDSDEDYMITAKEMEDILAMRAV